MKSGCQLVRMELAPGQPELGGVARSRGDGAGRFIGIVEPSALGRVVGAQIAALDRVHPQLQTWPRVVMPDYISFVLTVREDVDFSLDGLVAELAGRCDRAWKRVCDAYDIDPKGCVFSPGYRSLKGLNSAHCEAIREYVAESPRRYILPQLYPDIYRTPRHVSFMGRVYPYFGNHFLFRHPNMIVMHYDPKYSDGEWEVRCGFFREVACDGGVLLSSFLTPEEERVKQEFFKLGGSVIKIQPAGYGNDGKPEKPELDLCGEGRMLIVGMTGHDNDNEEIDARLAAEMHGLALAIADYHNPRPEIYRHRVE